MIDKTVTINSNFDSIKESKKTWQPVRNGKTFLKYLDSNKKISENDSKSLIDDSIDLIGKTINPKKIKITGLNSTGLCFGQIQSGKTTSMEAISALARDNDFKIII